MLWIDGDRFLEKLSAPGNPEDSLLRKETASEVLNCLHGLKESYRELLFLKYEMELSYKEIGTLLELPEQNVKTYLFRARNNSNVAGGMTNDE